MKRAVITGMGVVSPFGLGWERWVAGLRNAESAIRSISLFDANRPVRLGSSTQLPLPCRVAGEVPDFDEATWIAAKDHDRVPRVVPLALAATHEALHSAGLAELSLDERRDVHVVIGSGGGGFGFAEEQFARWFGRDERAMSPYAISSSIAGMVSSEISITHGFRGRSHTISDGCTSSSDALGYALDMIRSGRAHTIVCGGADACVTPAMMAGFCLMRAVPTHWNNDPAHASRPFSTDRDGFVLGEGAWIFTLEEREHALARGATVWAEVAGFGATCEAYHRVALGEPDEAARAMDMALKDAHVSADEIDYVNLHGTATQLNDPLETAAAKLALGERAKHIPMSSTKSQIGHPQGASGAAGICATVAAMHGNFAPPTINLDTADAYCDLDYVPNTAREYSFETALCNCLGFGSKNAALVLKR
jgi:3-oxoacyl-[acyl-carrier-protein] synthase II